MPSGSCGGRAGASLRGSWLPPDRRGIASSALSWLARSLLQELLFALFRVVEAQAPVCVRTDEEKLLELGAQGFRKGNGRVWGESDCLADSLLQLFIASGFVPEAVDRRSACEVNRARLECVPGLVPRDRDGRVVRGGMLQHHRHAEATLRLSRMVSSRSAFVPRGRRAASGACPLRR